MAAIVWRIANEAPFELIENVKIPKILQNLKNGLNALINLSIPKLLYNIQMKASLIKVRLSKNVTLLATNVI